MLRSTTEKQRKNIFLKDFQVVNLCQKLFSKLYQRQFYIYSFLPQCNEMEQLEASQQHPQCSMQVKY